MAITTEDEGRQYVIKHAKPHGLVDECVDEYDQHIKAGYKPDRAANDALHEWDI